MQALHDVLISHCVRRKVDPKCLDFGEIETTSQGQVKRMVSLEEGISRELAQQIVKQIKATESEADELCHEILVKLARSFVTPIDREDIHLLAHHMDDILDYVQGAADRLFLFKVSKLGHGIRELSEILNECAEILVLAMKRLLVLNQ